MYSEAYYNVYSEAYYNVSLGYWRWDERMGSVCQSNAAEFMASLNLAFMHSLGRVIRESSPSLSYRPVIF